MWDRVTYGKPKEGQKSSEKKTYTVEGSKGNSYKVVNDEGTWTCSCPAHGFGRGKDCKHIKNIKDGIERK
jgi:predicted nucleic acid-binding Zn finger protein